MACPLCWNSSAAEEVLGRALDFGAWQTIQLPPRYATENLRLHLESAQHQRRGHNVRWIRAKTVLLRPALWYALCFGYYPYHCR